MKIIAKRVLEEYKKIVDEKNSVNEKNEYNENYYSRKNFLEVIKKGGYVKGFGGKKAYFWKANFVKKHYKKNKGSILDIGCGEGQFLEAMPKQFEKYGLEISDTCVKNIKRKIKLKEDFVKKYLSTKI